MAKEVSLTIAKILNWSRTDHNARVEVAFYGLNSGVYLAHKTTLGYYNNQSLVLNTSFKIRFNPADHLIVCKISFLNDKDNPELIGSVEIDLQILMNRSLMFVPFQDHDKVLEIKLYESRKEQPDFVTEEQLKQQREDFLQQRFNFIDRISSHEVQLKKKFSEKVYNFLKELKLKNSDASGERQSNKKSTESGKESKKNEIDFRMRFGEERRRSDTKKNDIFSNLDQAAYRLSPTKHKVDQELLIHSVDANNKLDQQRQHENFRNAGEERPQAMRKEERQQKGVDGKEGNRKPKIDFGGILDRYEPVIQN